jgi:protocatechuate 3,4-dioxygenase beta subunit
MVSIRPLALSCGIALALGAAQQPAPAIGTGLVVGQVVDAASGAGVPGAVVTIGTYAAAVPAAAQLVDMNLAPPSPQNPRRILTTESGRFLFRDLPAGRYELSASGPGYAASIYGQGRPSGPGQFIELGEGQKLGAVAVRLWKLGVISGTVVDELGEPVIGTTVRYLRRVIAGGKPRFTAVAAQGSATTDDRGMYRLAGLPPGDYAIGVIFNPSTVPIAVVDANASALESGNPNASDAYRRLQSSATSSVSASGFRVGDLALPQLTTGSLILPAPAANGRLMAWQTTFYPAAPAPSQATLVTVRAGEERTGINLQLRLVPAVRVSGRVTGPDGPGSFLGMTLVAPTGSDYQSEGVAESASAISDANGAFTFLGVPPGEYALKIRMYPRAVASTSTITMTTAVMGAPTGGGRGTSAVPPSAMPSEPSLWASVPITVGNTDLENVAVVLRHGVRVRGRVQFTGTRAQPPADQVQRMQITLQWAEGRTSAPLPAIGRALPEGTFTTGGYAGNRYIIAVATLPAGWSLKSAMWNGRDVSVEPMDLTDSDITDVVLTFTDQVTELSGSVSGPKGPDGAIEVIVFPADTLAWKDIGVATRRSRNLRVDRAGRFSTSGLPAGEYFVAAVASASIREWNDPRFLEQLMPGATRVMLGDGEKKSVDVKTLTVR